MKKATNRRMQHADVDALHLSKRPRLEAPEAAATGALKLNNVRANRVSYS